MTALSPLSQLRIVLVTPLYGGNIGSVCRAMMNMGLSDLAIVDGDRAVDWEEAHKMALHAKVLLEKAGHFSSAAEAVADCGLVAATSARTGFYRLQAKTPDAWAPTLLRQATRQPVAIMFGPEDKGLSNSDLALATQLIEIPSTDAYKSLNLAQAVMVCCYELYKHSEVFEGMEEVSPQAPSALRERMFAMWEDTLYRIGFMKEDKAFHMMMGLRRILSRGPLSEDDIKILMGIAQQSKWVADRLRQREPDLF